MGAICSLNNKLNALRKILPEIMAKLVDSSEMKFEVQNSSVNN